MRLVVDGDPGFPETLRDLSRPPAQLFLIGDAALLRAPLVAIVGTREATAYGLRVARSVSGAMARAGVGIVSGMARGIDAAAHRAALECGGKTVAVLGTGVDIAYPSGHRELHRVIGSSGLLLSEYEPGATAHRGSFPQRNRIIAALARATIVIEAGHHSGALNTASHALALNRPLAAVPGPIDSPQSDGTNQLIRDGALVIASVADALALMGIADRPQSAPMDLPGNAGLVWSALAAGPLSMDALSVRAMINARDCAAAVTTLELKGMAESLVTGEVRRR